MCGIVYSQSFTGQPVNELIEDQYIKQIHRGTEGFGLFNGQHLVHAAQEQRILNWLHKPKNQSDLIMFHHRKPTSTINVRRAAHPFSTKDYFGDTQYLLVHNGYIGNDDELFEKHQELGIEYQSLLPDLTFNDSEALLWDVALYLEGKQDQLEAWGAIAFVCMKLVNGQLDKLYFGRNRNPLNLLRTKDGIMLSSEGEGEPILSNQLYTYNYQLKRLTKKWLKIREWKPYVQGQGSLLPYANSWDNYNIPTYPASYTGSSGPIWDATNNDWAEAEAAADDDYDYGVMPTDNEVSNVIRDYLTRAEGHFETAYWLLEQEYDDLEQEYQTKAVMDRLNLLEMAIYQLQADPDYLNETSVSNDFGGSKWFKQLHLSN